MENWWKSLGISWRCLLLQPCWGFGLSVLRSCSKFCSCQFFSFCWTSTFQLWLRGEEMGLLLSEQHSKNWEVGLYRACSFLLKFLLKSRLCKELMAPVGFQHEKGKCFFPPHFCLQLELVSWGFWEVSDGESCWSLREAAALVSFWWLWKSREHKLPSVWCLFWSEIRKHTNDGLVATQY